ncbi:hypothetical protein B0H17DRAFT_956584 [Mycena rosella]|uniref:DUF6534 domain-containing protein n=1 Tax=Mycena rosella TaxID=1033263 RepID=A0AAD7CPH4_MYCRO|nr:hypothetical protein B0H17DRAFT_956584 [Mycena rosella]
MVASDSHAFDGTLGRVQIGLLVAIFLFGIETLQTFNYYRDFPRDSRVLKTVVCPHHRVLTGAPLTRSIIQIYSMTVTLYGQPQSIPYPPISLVVTIPLQATMNFVMQTFFAVRVRVLSKRWAITILCCILNFLRLAFNLGLFVELWKRPDFSFLMTNLRWIMVTVSSIGPIVDVLVAISLCYWLWRYKKSDFIQTSRMVDTLIIWTVGRACSLVNAYECLAFDSSQRPRRLQRDHAIVPRVSL